MKTLHRWDQHGSSLKSRALVTWSYLQSGLPGNVVSRVLGPLFLRNFHHSPVSFPLPVCDLVVLKSWHEESQAKAGNHRLMFMGPLGESWGKIIDLLGLKPRDFFFLALTEPHFYQGWVAFMHCVRSGEGPGYRPVDPSTNWIPLELALSVRRTVRGQEEGFWGQVFQRPMDLTVYCILVCPKYYWEFLKLAKHFYSIIINKLFGKGNQEFISMH